MSKIFKMLSLAMVSLFFAAPPAWPTTVMKLNVVDLTLMADAIFVGKCIEVEEQWEEAKGKIYSYATFDVVDLVKGDVPGRVTVKSLGGQVGNLKMIVPGSPKFSVDEEYLLFLWKDRSGGYRVLGMNQGKYNVYTENATGQKFLKKGAIAPGDGDYAPRDGKDQALQDFLSKITSILNAEGTRPSGK